jgi:hypothetical protein
MLYEQLLALWAKMWPVLKRAGKKGFYSCGGSHICKYFYLSVIGGNIITLIIIEIDND